MKRTLGVIVSEYLTRHKTKQLTSRQLAEMVVKTEHEFVAKKVKKTEKEDKALVFQLMSEISAQYPAFKKYHIGKTTERPYKYYYQKPAVKAK